MPGLRIAIVGSGFAGSILARVLHGQGHRVTLLDRRRHPRFALGESSTPLAALSLERLASRYHLPDLAHLAAYGRWSRHLPDLRRGLKRGFTFYGHTPGQPYANGPDNDHRLLVAASPNENVADAHWLRSDVDAFLFARARAEGVDCREMAEITTVERVGEGWHLAGYLEEASREWSLDADLLVDASGAGGFLARHLAIPSALGWRSLATSLLYGHFTGLRTLQEVAPQAKFPPGPYPDEQAAVHHLLAEGWMYVLPFDHGVASAGVVLADHETRRWASMVPAAQAWAEILARYPSLAAVFAAARPVREVTFVPRLQQRLAAASGPGWVLLPHAFAFFSPMFSTGIAWSLLAVERLALLLDGATQVPQLGLDDYSALLGREAEHLAELTEASYRAAGRSFDLFVAWTDLYFAAASFAEARQRLCVPRKGREWAWEGFLGATDPVFPGIQEELSEDLFEIVESGFLSMPSRKASARAAKRFARKVRWLIHPRNVAGLADPARRRLYPVDLAALERSAHLLGLAKDVLRSRLDRLRSDSEA